MINDNKIKKSAYNAHDALLKVNIPSPEPSHIFSKEFENKIKSLLSRTLQKN